MFSLINSITKKDIPKSFKIYNELIERGEEINKIVIMVCDQFRLIYNVKILMDEGKSSDSITKILGIHPYRVKLAMDLSYSFTFGDLKRYLEELRNIDIGTKTGKSPNDLGFDIFLLGL